MGFVKSSFFKVRLFHDAEDLRQQLRDWHREVNEERPCRATGIIPRLRLAEEAPRLRTLKVQPEQLALRVPVYVGPTGTVVHDGHSYSMPPEAISMPDMFYKKSGLPKEIAEDEYRKSYATQDTYEGYLKKWILPRWKSYRLPDVKSVQVEQWLKSLTLAPASKAKIRNIMSALYSHALRWE